MMMKNKKIKKYLTYLISFSFIFLVVLNFNNEKINSSNFVNEVFACDNPPCSSNTTQGSGINTATNGKTYSEKTPSYNDSGIFNNYIVAVIFYLLIAIAKLITLMVNLISFSLSPEMMSIYNNPGLKAGWSTVRDFLNIFFIFFLLFSAFATIFQVSKYHIKSTWVMIVVMALLVNFSWPISRVLIDVSNITMSYIIGDAGDSTTSKGLMAELGNNANFVEMMIGQSHFDRKKNKTKVADEGGVVGLATAIILGVVIGSIFLFTVGVIALLLLIRVILLAVLLVFSSAGFVFMAFPSTRSIASQWWDAFTKQLFLGPVVLFSLLIAVTVTSAMESSFESASKSITNAAFAPMPGYAVTVILMWVGVLAAQKISGQSAGMALNVAKKTRGMVQRGGLKAGSFVGREVAQRTNTGIHKGTRALQRKMTGNENAQGLNIAAVGQTTKDRFEGAKKARENARKELSAEAQANYMATGAENGEEGKIKGFVKKNTIGYGADKNSFVKLQNDKYVTQKKKISESGIDSEGAVKKAQKAKSEGELRAFLEHGMKDDDFGGDRDVYNDLVTNINKVVTSEKDRGKYINKINKKYDKKGNDDLTFTTEVLMEAGKAGGKSATQIAKDKFSKYDGEQIAKSSVFKALNKDTGNEALKAGVRELSNTFNSKGAEFQSKALDKMTTDQKKEVNESRNNI